MSKLMIALGSMGMMSKNKSCPDCGMPLEGNGCCSECGYGEDSMEEEKDDQAEAQSLLDLRDHLQTALKLVDRMIVSGSKSYSESEDSAPAPMNTVTWVRQGSRNS